MELLLAHEIGEGIPVLIIHGWELQGEVEARDLEPIFTKVPRFLRIYVDLPGMGKTPANNVKNLDDMLLRLVQFIDARLEKSRFLVTGSSCGAYLARAVAEKYAEQVDGLLLRVPLIEPENSLRDLDPFEPLVQNDELISSLSEKNKKLLGDIHIQTPAYIKSLKAKYDEAYIPALKAADKDILQAIRTDPQRYRLSDPPDDGHPKVLAPTLIVCGRQDDAVGYRDSLRLLELYPRSTFAVLDRSTHALPVDESENKVFEALVCDWLMRVNEWRGRTNA